MVTQSGTKRAYWGGGVTRSCHYAWALCLLRSPDWSENIARLLRDTRETGDQDRDRRINWASPGQRYAGGWPAEVPTFRLRASHAAITRSRISSFELAGRRQDVKHSNLRTANCAHRAGPRRDRHLEARPEFRLRAGPARARPAAPPSTGLIYAAGSISASPLSGSWRFRRWRGDSTSISSSVGHTRPDSRWPPRV